MLEFKENETIEVIDTQAWIESDNERVEIQLLVTNIRFLAVKETPKGKFIICDFNLDELEKVEHQSQNTTCLLSGNRFVKFDSDPIGEYLLKFVSNQ